jgi:hypothetical protein
VSRLRAGTSQLVNKTSKNSCSEPSWFESRYERAEALLAVDSYCVCSWQESFFWWFFTYRCLLSVMFNSTCGNELKDNFFEIFRKHGIEYVIIFCKDSECQALWLSCELYQTEEHYNRKQSLCFQHAVFLEKAIITVSFTKGLEMPWWWSSIFLLSRIRTVQPTHFSTKGSCSNSTNILGIRWNRLRHCKILVIEYHGLSTAATRRCWPMNSECRSGEWQCNWLACESRRLEFF